MHENKCKPIFICETIGKNKCLYFSDNGSNICKYCEQIDLDYYCSSKVAQVNKITLLLKDNSIFLKGKLF